jgi:hypothetical protein
MKRALLLISSFSVLIILPLLSINTHGQNMTKDEDLSILEKLVTIFHYFVYILIAVVGAAVGVALWINSQTNSLRKDLKDHIDKEIKELKDDLIRQIDKLENRITYIERTAMSKSLRDAPDIIRELGERE